jgi:23S rRNA (uracil1939-C5)-methyltransferase
MRAHRRKDAQRRKARAQTIPQAPASSLLVQIEKPVYGGEFLAHAEGKAVFVPLTLPGEQVRVRVVDEKRGYAKAEVEEIVSAAAERIAARCGHFGACGGCQYQHTEYSTQLAFKQAILRETFERGGVCLPGEASVLAEEPWVYRNRIRVAFDGEGFAGYRARRSHALTRIAECPIAAPLLVRAAMAAGEMVRDLPRNLRPREVSLFCDAAEDALLVSILTADSGTRWFEVFAQGFAERVSETKSIELAVDTGGEELRSVAQWGASSLLYRAAGFDYRVDQGAFFQVNRWLVDPLVDLVTGGEQGKVAWDLFAGVGLFARQFADCFDHVVAVEAAAGAAAALAENLLGTGATAVKGTTDDFLRGAGKRERPDLIVVDPPRSGLGAEATAMLGRIGAPRLTYVSCDPATLARDLRALIGTGYTIHKVALVDLFPQTFHLETVVRLRR